MPVDKRIFEIGVQKTKAIEDAFVQFGKTASRTAVSQAQRQALKPMLKAAKANAPRRTGLSKKSIKIIPLKPRSGEVTRMAVAPTGAGFVLLFAEKGTFKQAAEPWLEPARDAHIDFYIKHIHLFIAQKFEKIAKKMKTQLERGKVTARTARILSR